MEPIAPTVPGDIDLRDFADLTGTARETTPRPAGNSGNALRPAWNHSHSSIKQAVLRILQAEEPIEDNRWHPRPVFVRPATVSFPCPTPGSPLADAGGQSTKSTARLEVFMTDVTVGGAGIISHSPLGPLPLQVTLVVDGAVFHCKVCWSKRIGELYRYGLQLLAVLDNS